VSVGSAIKKLLRDPMAFCLDSRHARLNRVGSNMLTRERERFLAEGERAADTKISVIMTAYNTGEHIEAAIRSVLAQSHENLELMVIDDASTDDTIVRVRAIAEKDDRLKLFASPMNHGTYWSKNWCLSHAETDFVTFHDSDDISHPDRLRIQLGAMMSTSSLAAVTCRWRRVTEGGGVAVMGNKPSRLAVISLMIRRSLVLGETGYFDSVRIAADTEYLMRLERIYGAKRIKNMRHILYTGLIRDGSLTTTKGGGQLWQAQETNSSLRNGQTMGAAATPPNYERFLQGSRAAYHEAFLKWHRDVGENSRNLSMPFPLDDRPFPVPEELTTGCDHDDMRSVKQVLVS